MKICQGVREVVSSRGYLPGSDTVKVRFVVSVQDRFRDVTVSLRTLTEIKYKVIMSNSALCTVARSVIYPISAGIQNTPWAAPTPCTQLPKHTSSYTLPGKAWHDLARTWAIGNYVGVSSVQLLPFPSSRMEASAPTQSGQKTVSIWGLGEHTRYHCPLTRERGALGPKPMM